MEIQTDFQSSKYEQTLINIIRKLPPERILQVVDFAQFLELQIVQKSSDDWLNEEKNETKESFQANEKKWDELLDKPEAKRVMRKMAYEALEDSRAGRTTDIAITEDGRLTPE
ncbi:MAG: hypothetical protein J7K84_09470 [Deltaproteobacteria bacterium]|nr:hypothetical protein [Deltaproteobacteria bacterium]